MDFDFSCYCTVDSCTFMWVFPCKNVTKWASVDIVLIYIKLDFILHTTCVIKGLCRLALQVLTLKVNSIR